MQLSYVPVPLVEAPNAAIRLRARNALYLITRWSATATQGQHGFQVHVASSEGKSALIGGWITDVSNGTPNSFLPVQMPKLNFPPDQEYELELRAYGDRLTVLVNGKVEHEATNAALLGQWLAIKNASGPCYFKSLDWRPLDAQGNPKLTAPAPSTPVVSVTLPALPNPTTWTDTKGRSITATFKGIEGDKVMLAIAGKLTPVALNTLSAESQKLAQVHQQQQVAALFDAGTATNPAEATKAAPFINSLGMKFVPVPGTKVLFCIHETRCDDYAAYEAAVPRVDGSWKQKTIDGLPFSARRDHPVVNVNWDDAQAFCAWLSQKEGNRYRLPTDREWSHAVGIGQMEKVPNGTTPELIQMLAGVYPWGGGYPPKTSDQAGNYADMAWKELLRGQRCIDGYDDGFPATAPVMSYKANQLGLFDLGGNAQEWCEDWYDATRTKRVLRGSSWIKSPQSYLLSSYRDGFGPSRRNDSNGFRCVVELPAP